MQEPLVSIIVPSFNHERYIDECIRSIVCQAYSNFELIVIDDGSKDNSPQIIRQLAAELGFKYILQQNIGLTKTLNNVIKNHVNGKYIIQFASDDVMCQNRIAKQVNYMENNPHFAMSYSKALVIDEDSKILGPCEVVIKTGWVFNDLFLAKFNIPAYTCIYRTEVFADIGYYDEDAFIEDSDIYYKISSKYQVGYLDIISAKYRRHGANMSKRFPELYKDTFRRLKKYETNPKYNEAVFISKRHWFFLLSYEYKADAIKLLPTVIVKPFSKLFVGGCLNLIGLKVLTKKYFR